MIEENPDRSGKKLIASKMTSVPLPGRRLVLPVLTILCIVQPALTIDFLAVTGRRTTNRSVFHNRFPKDFDLLASPHAGSILPGLYLCDLTNLSNSDHLCQTGRRHPVSTYLDTENFARSFGIELWSFFVSEAFDKVWLLLREQKHGYIALIQARLPLKSLSFSKNDAIFLNATFRSSEDPWLDVLPSSADVLPTGFSSVSSCNGTIFFTFHGLFGSKENGTREEIQLRSLSKSLDCRKPARFQEFNLLRCSSLVVVLASKLNPLRSEIRPALRAGRTLACAVHESTKLDPLLFTQIFVPERGGHRRILKEVNARSHKVRILSSSSIPTSSLRDVPLSGSVVTRNRKICWAENKETDTVLACSKLGGQFFAAISYPLGNSSCNSSESTVSLSDAAVAMFCPPSKTIHVASFAEGTIRSATLSSDFNEDIFGVFLAPSKITTALQPRGLSDNLLGMRREASPVKNGTGLLFSSDQTSIQLPGLFGCAKIDDDGQCVNYAAQYVGAMSKASPVDGDLVLEYVLVSSMSHGSLGGEKKLLAFDRGSLRLFLAPLPPRPSGLFVPSDCLFSGSTDPSLQFGAFALFEGKIFFTLVYREGFYSTLHTIMEIRELRVSTTQGNESLNIPTLSDKCVSHLDRLNVFSCTTFVSRVTQIPHTRPDVAMEVTPGSDLVIVRQRGRRQYFTSYIVSVTYADEPTATLRRNLLVSGGMSGQNLGSILDHADLTAPALPISASLTADRFRICWSGNGHSLSCRTLETHSNTSLHQIFDRIPQELCEREDHGREATLTALTALSPHRLVIGCSTGGGLIRFVRNTVEVESLKPLVGPLSPILRVVAVDSKELVSSSRR